MATATQNGHQANGRMPADEPENPLHRLSDEQIEQIGKEFDELHEASKDDLGERDSTNIRGKDKDLGYEIMRIDPHQKWHPAYVLQPFYNILLMLLFEWGVALHDLDLDAVRAGDKSHKEVLKDLKGIAGKARLQIQKDYIPWPIISG